jgi:hypothetical protein
MKLYLGDAVQTLRAYRLTLRCNVFMPALGLLRKPYK